MRAKVEDARMRALVCESFETLATELFDSPSKKDASSDEVGRGFRAAVDEPAATGY